MLADVGDLDAPIYFIWDCKAVGVTFSAPLACSLLWVKVGLGFEFGSLVGVLISSGDIPAAPSMGGRGPKPV